MNLRAKALAAAYKLFPFPLTGDLRPNGGSVQCDISCVINFYGRIELLEGILYSLLLQSLPKRDFEVILVEDKNGTREGRDISEKFGELLNVKYFALSTNCGKMGFSRNFGLSKATGKYVLFLDDDTVILQRDFLSILINEFESSKADAIMSLGSASYCLLKGRYSFHDPYFPSNRCMAHRREALRKLGGFLSEIIGQEDVELVIRFIASGMILRASSRLSYLHPPMIVNDLGKPAAVGVSFARLRKRYPLFIWLAMLLNGLRWFPLLLWPISTKCRMQGRFSAGFLLGIFYSIMGRKIEYN